jgi:ATP-binding cassette subfamily F protein 3
MISIENLSKHYGRQVLFEDVSLRVNRRERIGLVGRNGHGKTTLLRLITGEEQPDAGAISIPRGYRLGHVRQHLSFSCDSILQEAMQGLPGREAHHQWKVEKILAGLGFSRADLQRHPADFSGGFQVRLNLAKVLVAEPDLLLLDEPTNYLDITSIRWIEQFLLAWPRELLLITHDRSFMDRVVTHIVGIHRRRLRKIEGTTEKYYSRIAQDEEVYEKTRLNDERRRREIELFISRFRAKARLAGLVQSRVKTLARQGRQEKLEEIKNLEFSFQSLPFAARFMLSAEDLEFAYHTDQPLIQDFSLSVAAGDRVCVIGRNGRGKTTLLKLLADRLQPRQGSVSVNPNVVRGFYEQTNIQSLVPSRTVEEEILYSHSRVDSYLARSICGAMMFEGDAALKTISLLSGGEKARVLLGKIIATPVNLLLLDEPTNHLDMESCDSLLAALDSFEGALVMVTHNELFLHALARRLVVFGERGISVFEGTYQDFLERDGWEEQAGGVRDQRPPSNPVPEGGKVSRRDLRRRRSEVITERGKILNPLERRIEAVENRIGDRECDLARHVRDLEEAGRQQDGRRIAGISRDMHACQEEIDRLFDELESLTQQFDHHKAVFEARLRDLDQTALS